MARGAAHSDETNAAVIAALLAGQGVSEVARDYKLPKSTVSRIKSGLSAGQLEQVGTEKAEKIEGLLVGYLEAILTALTAQAEVAGDKDYLKKYPPTQLATLHGVMADKAVRLLEASSQAEETGKPDEDE